MPVITISSREFNQDTAGAKKAARRGAVFITDRGEPSHVLLSIDEYKALLGNSPNIVDVLEMAGSEGIEFDPPKLQGSLARPAEFT
jgi:prevent-host-death family protein